MFWVSSITIAPFELELTLLTTIVQPIKHSQEPGKCLVIHLGTMVRFSSDRGYSERLACFDSCRWPQSESKRERTKPTHRDEAHEVLASQRDCTLITSRAKSIRKYREAFGFAEKMQGLCNLLTESLSVSNVQKILHHKAPRQPSFKRFW